MATASELLTMIAEAEAKRHEVALGSAVVDVWRDGRRMRMRVSSIEELNAYIAELRREYEAAVADDSGRPRRRPIGLMWKN